MIKIHIRRKVSEEKKEELKLLINQLRSITMGRPGYIAGETLKRLDKPDESLVVTKWQSEYYWNQWFQNKERSTIQDKIDQLLAEETQYEVYESLELLILGSGRVIPIVRYDGRTIGTGEPGPVSRRLWELFERDVAEGPSEARTPVLY